MIKTVLIYLGAYAGLALGFYYSRDEFWDYCRKKYSRGLTKLKNLKCKLPILGQILRGEQLQGQCIRFLAALEQSLDIVPMELSQYKFYSELMAHLIVLRRKYGTSLKKQFPLIRNQLNRDVIFEKKVFTQVKSSFGQFILVALTTWLFVYISRQIVFIPMSYGTIFLMIFWQLLGVVFFVFFYLKIKSKRFSYFNSALKELYSFTLLLDSALALNQSLESSGILHNTLANHKALEKQFDHFKKLIDRLKTFGVSPVAECFEMVDQIWLMQDEEFDKFVNVVLVLKFTTLTLFFLPAYFLYLTAIFKFFMEQ